MHLSNTETADRILLSIDVLNKLSTRVLENTESVRERVTEVRWQLRQLAVRTQLSAEASILSSSLLRENEEVADWSPPREILCSSSGAEDKQAPKAEKQVKLLATGNGKQDTTMCEAAIEKARPVNRCSESNAIAAASADTTLAPIANDPLTTISRTCICGGADAGLMIMCGGTKCPHEWYHTDCVGIEAVPDGDWLCPLCVE